MQLLQKNSVFLLSFFLFSFHSTFSHAEQFIYIEDKPELWLYPQDPVYQSWYQHADLINLAKQMEGEGQDSLVFFTQTALNQMAVLYQEEVMKTKQENDAGAGKNLQKYRWRNSAIEYAEQLKQVAENISTASEIELYIESHGEPTIIINGKPYILTTPNLKKTGLLYSRIIEEFCHKGRCEHLNIVKEREKDKLRIVVNAEWDLSQKDQPRFYSEDGLSFIFKDIKNRKIKQEKSLQLMRELRLIADSLQGLTTKGVTVEQNYFELEQISGSYGYKLTLNSFGDSLKLELLQLGKNKSLLKELGPWFEAQQNNETYQHTFEGVM